MVHRVAVVTGGASGIGEATCHHLADAGHSIGVLDIDGAGARRVTEQLRASGAEAIDLSVDVADRGSVDEAFAKIRTELGAIQVLATCAGMIAFDEFADISPESWNRIIDVNLTGTFHCCQAALPDMKKAGWGRIITISSSSAQRGSP